MSSAAQLIQRAAYALVMGLIDLAGFLSFATAVLGASRQRAGLEAELDLMATLTDAGYVPTPVGVVMPDTHKRDEQALMTVLQKMDLRIEGLREKVEDSGNPPKGIIRHTTLIDTLPVEETPSVPEEDKSPIVLDDPDRLTSLIEAIEQESKQEASTLAMESQKITHYKFVPDADACPKCKADSGKIYPTRHKASHHNHCKCNSEPIIINNIKEVA